MKYLGILLFVLVVTSCQSQTKKKQVLVNYDQPFKDYWFAGQAEINAYELKQSRYGSVRPGEAVLIFVTEDFSKKKQVKLDDPAASHTAQKVLKLNFIKKFRTGIYPYSMMESVFTPLDLAGQTTKLTMSSQEWCGHVYAQLNRRNGYFDVKGYSYFEKEGDVSAQIKAALLEDEIWNIIKLNPNLLPLGKHNMVPALFATRMNHKGLEAEPVELELKTVDGLQHYTMAYASGSRVVTIYFESKFPHKITGWKETEYADNGQTHTTSARLKATRLLDYWNKNKNEDRPWYDSLQLGNY